jgi:hypothetical protein
MAKNLKIGDTQRNKSNPACKSAEHCCWYETSKEFSNVCSHRNELICHLRRQEVFDDQPLKEDAFAQA